MALRTAVQAGPWNVAGTWDTIVPAAGDTVNLGTYTVTVPNGYTTNDVGNIDGGGAGGKLVIANGGKLDLQGIATFDSGEEFEMEEGGEVEEVCAADNAASYIKMNAGSILTLPGNVATLPLIRGTDATHRPIYGLWIAGALDAASVIDGLHLKWTYSIGLFVYTGFQAPPIISNVHIEAFYDYGIQARAMWGGLRLRNICIHGGRRGIYARECHIRGYNITLGEDLAGGADTHSIHDVYVSAQGGVSFENARLLSTTATTLGYHGHVVNVQNSGYIAGDGILTERGTIGVDKVWTYEGTIEDSGGAKLCTPNSNCDSDWPLKVGVPGVFPIHAPVPVSGGDTVALSADVTLNASQPANSVKLVIDPYDLWDANDESSEATPQSTETTLTAEGTVKSGSFTGKLPYEIQINDYGAGGTVSIDAPVLAKS